MNAQAEVTEDVNEGDQIMADDADNATDAGATAPYAENLSIETATADVQRALEEYGDEYPYPMHFHPDVEIPILAFDPTMVQDSFDPFDLADYINMDD
jgi:hypothetical protein